MIAEALKYLRELGQDADIIRTIDHKGQTFSPNSLVRIPDEKPVPDVQLLEVATLRSLVGYILSNPDSFDEGTFVSVLSPTLVEIVTPIIGEKARRKTFARAKARVPKLATDTYLDPEDLGVHLRTCFTDTTSRDEIVAFLGGIVDQSTVETKDDGITQSATVRSGLSMVKAGDVPSPVYLDPIRTFHDVGQEPSPYILRLKKMPSGGIGAALFCADGGAWEHYATESVAEYLRAEQSLPVFA